MMSKKVIKIICIVLAILMVLSGVAVVFSTFAVGGRFVPTGDNDLDMIVPIAIGIIAVVVIIVCLVLPRIKKKDKE